MSRSSPLLVVKNKNRVESPTMSVWYCHYNKLSRCADNSIFSLLLKLTSLCLFKSCWKQGNSCWGRLPLGEPFTQVRDLLRPHKYYCGSASPLHKSAVLLDILRLKPHVLRALFRLDFYEYAAWPNLCIAQK